MIREYKERIEVMPEWSVQKISIVMLSYNLKDICKQCIQSIRENNHPDSYELIVVDNASTDGIVDWLKEWDDIKLICNQENKGFPYGCNQGIKVSEPDNDIFLLNNDTVVFPNSIFWLRMGLYENDKIGATGSISNYVGNNQQINVKCDSLEEYRDLASKINVPMRNPYENKVWLVGFALLIKRTAMDEVGLLDTRFTPGGFEDDDIGVRLQYAGWKLLLCWNSFILHYGSGAGKNTNLWNSLESKNAKKFKEKWGFDIQYYTWARTDIISLIELDEEKPIKVLEVGCGCGATLAKIQYIWPNASVSGIELVEAVARIGGNYLDVCQGNIESMELPYEKESFDYIIFGDVLEHLYDPKAVLERMKPYLKENGQFICSIPNLMNESVILSLLKGEFEYTEAGILDRTHIRFFTLNSIVRMMRACGLKIDKFFARVDNVQKSARDEEMLEALYQIPGVADSALFAATQYVLRIKKVDG